MIPLRESAASKLASGNPSDAASDSTNLMFSIYLRRLMRQ